MHSFKICPNSIRINWPNILIQEENNKIPSTFYKLKLEQLGKLVQYVAGDKT